MDVKKPIAAFTITRNEPFFLRIWCNYYADSFPHEDLFILDNSSDDGSVDKIKEIFPKINIVEVPSEKAYDHTWLRKTVMDFQTSLLTKYEVVCFAETDEFLIPDQRYKNIYEYCECFRKNKHPFNENDLSLRSKAWAVIHQFEYEPDIDINTDIYLLENRNVMRRLPFYDKVLITKKPIKYSKGFHVDNENQNKEVRDDLELFHAWHVDLKLHVEKVTRHKKMKIVKHVNGFSDIEDAKFFFKNGIEKNANSSCYSNELAEVPSYWKKLFRI